MAGIAELDLSDLTDTPSPQPVDQLAPVFAAEVASAARQNSKVLAAAESRDAANMIEGKLAGEADKLLARTASQNPRLGSLRVKLHARIYREAPKGFYREPAKIVLGWLELPHRLLDRKGKDIIATLQERYSGYPIRKDFMSRPLHWMQSKHAQKLMADHGVPTEPADCRSLSSIKKRLKDHRNPPEYEVFKAVIKIAKDESHVVWNNERYSVFRNGAVLTIKRHGRRVALATIRKLVEE